MRHVRFEAIGNAAIFTDAQQDATNASITSDLFIEQPGFSWNATYKIAARDKNYAIVLSQTSRIIMVLGGSSPFTAGTSGIFHVKLAGHDALVLQNSGALTTDVTIDSGGGAVYAYAAPVVNGTSPSFTGMDLTSGSGYVRWSGSNTRIGGDATAIYVDSPSSSVTWRDSSAGYAQTAALYSVGFQVSAGRILRSGIAATASRPSGHNSRRCCDVLRLNPVKAHLV